MIKPRRLVCMGNKTMKRLQAKKEALIEELQEEQYLKSDELTR